MAIAYKPFIAMKKNTSKERNFYTQGQRFAARVLFILWLLASGSPEGTLAAPQHQSAMALVTTTSPQGSSLASTPPTPLPGGALQLPPDSLGPPSDSSPPPILSLEGSLQLPLSPSKPSCDNSVANTPAMERVFQPRMRQEAPLDPERGLLSTSPKISPVSENLSFQAREGERVRFSYQMGQWRAEVSSHLGAFSRSAVLPVVCSQGENVASSLEVLSRYPNWYSQRQIHVLDRNVCPTLGEVVYIGALGLKGGVEGEASGSGAPAQPTIPQSLRDLRHSPSPYECAMLSAHARIDNLQEGDAVVWRDPDTQQDHTIDGWKVAQVLILHEDKPTGLFSKLLTQLEFSYGYGAVLYTNDQKKQHVLAYRGTDPKNMTDLWTDWKSIALNRIQGYERDMPGILEQTISCAQAKHYSLTITGHSLGGWLAQVTAFLAKDKHKIHLKAITFDPPGARPMLEQINPSINPIDLKKELDITNYLSAPNLINAWNPHVGTVYRIVFGAFPPTLKEYNLQTHVLSTLIKALDPSTGDAHKCIQVNSWPVVSKQIVQMGASSAESVTLDAVRLLGQLFQWYINQESLGKYNGFFKFAKQVNQYHPEGADLSIQDDFDLNYKYHYNTAPFDRSTLHIRHFPEYTRPFLKGLVNRSQPCVALAQQNPYLQGISWQWNKDTGWVNIPPGEDAKICCDQLIAIMGDPELSQDVWRPVFRARLKSYYSDEYFTCVPSLAGNQSKHVKDLQCQLMLREQKLTKKDQETLGASNQQYQMASHHASLQEVQTPIGLVDLFKKRSLKPGAPAQEISRIFLTGDPGTGKTTLSKQLAYEWAQGTWGQEFDALYLLTVRSLQEHEYDGKDYDRKKNLATAIVNNCFTPPSNEEAYKLLRDHIEQELQKPTTLVILDGLDERAGTSEQILRQAQSGSHKLLMLSRPDGVETKRQGAYIEIEHRGFNDNQLKSYVQNAVSNATLAESLLAYIEGNKAIKKIVHIPVHLEIVCTLWEDESSGVRAALEQGSLPSLYRKVTTWLWRRYAKKWELNNVSADPLFNMLGQIALDAFKPGTKISSDFVNDYITTEAEEASLRNSGLLQCVRERSADASSLYQFAHKTFQEYFAGRWLAVKFLGDEAVRKQCKKFVENYKYDSSYGQTLSFFSGELYRQLSKQSIDHCDQLSRLLEWLDSGQKEVVGLQHVLLQAGMLHEWLCLAASEEHKDFFRIGSKVVDNLQAWLSKSIKISYSPQGQQAVDQLMDDYWASKDPALVRYIAGKLQQTPLVIRPSQRQGYNEEAVLYLEGGNYKVWRGTSEEIALLRDLLALELVKDPKSCHAYSYGDGRKIVSFYERALAMYEQVYKEAPNHPAIATILSNLGNAWNDLGEANKALSYHERVLPILQKVYEKTPNHPHIAHALNNLGAAWCDLGDTGKAVSYYERALEILQKVYKEAPNQPDIAMILNNLGAGWRALGDAPKAVSYHERVLKIREEVYKEEPNHPDIASTLHNLGITWSYLGDMHKSVNYFDRALSIYEQVHKEEPNHPHIASTLHNLGYVWDDLGDARKAVSYYERALSIYEQVYKEAPNQPDIARNLSNLGYAWVGLGDVRKAQSYLERALAILQEVYKEAPNHPHIASTLHNLGITWNYLGDARKAVNYCDRALAIYEQVHKEAPNHPDIASTLNNLGEAWSALGNARKAVSCFERALAIYEQVHKEDPNHSDIADILCHLGKAWRALGDARKSVSYYERALKIYEQVHKEAPNQPDIACTLYNLGEASGALDDARKAVSYYERALVAYEQVHKEAPNQPDIARTLHNLGDAWRALGDASKAQSYLERALAIFEQVHNTAPNHPDIARTLNNLGVAWTSLSNMNKAASCFERALSVCEQIYQETPNHPDIANNLHNLGSTWGLLGDMRKAVSYYERALAIYKQLYGPSHPAVTRTLLALMLFRRP